VGFCEHCSEPSVCLKREEFLVYLSDSHFLEMNSVPSNYFLFCLSCVTSVTADGEARSLLPLPSVHGGRRVVMPEQGTDCLTL
jgi:hypothetical protein